MNKGIQKENLKEDEHYFEFQRMASYVVPAEGKHEIVHNERQEDIGIAISKNGRTDFRKFKTKRIYWYTGPYAYIAEVPMTSQGITIDLSHLV